MIILQCKQTDYKYVNNLFNLKHQQLRTCKFHTRDDPPSRVYIYLACPVIYVSVCINFENEYIYVCYHISLAHVIATRTPQMK